MVTVKDGFAAGSTLGRSVALDPLRAYESERTRHSPTKSV